MGCAGSKAAGQLDSANVPVAQQQQQPAIRAYMQTLGLGQYADALVDLGYDDVEYLRDASQDDLLEIAKKVSMLDGHAGKWVRSLSGASVSPSKLAHALSSRPNDASAEPAEKPPIDLDEVKLEDRALFNFIKADELRACSAARLPRFQDLRQQHPTWFEELEITLEGACAHEYAGRILAVSHRWEAQGQPDTEGLQLAAVRTYVVEHPDVTHVWLDFYCAPQWQRTAEEDKIFQRTLRFISRLFLGASVLILCDRTYTTRFWTLFEAWLSMQRATASGLLPAARAARRCDIVPIHLANEATIQELERLVADKSIDEAYKMLESPE